MASLESSLYTVALALCMFSAGILSKRETRSGRAVSWFVVYLAVESLGFALELVHPSSPLKALWLGLLMTSSLLTAPCLWLAVLEAVTGERPGWKRLIRGHFFVVGMGGLLVLPLIGSAQIGPEWGSAYGAHPPWFFRYITTGMMGCMVLFGLQVPVYLRRAQRLLSAPPIGATGVTSLAQRAWLHLPLIAVGTTWVLGMLRTVQCAAHASPALLGLFAFIDVSVTVGALYMILRREFVRQAAPVADAQVLDTEREGAEDHAELPVVGTKYARSALDVAHRTRIRHKLDRVFVGQSLHRDSMLNLHALSQATGEKPHYVSQVLNQDLGTTFYDYVNRHRIEEAKHRLAAAPDPTVLEIALAVGFNSKSTFNTAFRRHTGQTPSAFRAAMAAAAHVAPPSPPARGATSAAPGSG